MKQQNDALKLKFFPEKKINIPASKSISHRAIICTMLANGKISDIKNLGDSNDIKATINSLKNIMSDQKIADCNESGSTLRFLIPIAYAICNKPITFTGSQKLFDRPLSVYEEIFTKKNGYVYEKKGNKLTVSGRLQPGIFKVRGDISSQFISGLLFALPLLEKESQIVITTKLESKSYIDLTIDVLKSFGIKIIEQKNKFIIPGKQKYHKCYYCVEPDYSQAAFWLVAKALGNKITINKMNKNSRQGDKEIVNIINQVTKNNFKAITVDATNIPDLVPIITVLMCFLKGTSKIINAARVRLKESDRLHAIAVELNKLGANIKELKDGLVIKGMQPLHGGNVDAWNDHRIAMSLAIISTKIEDDIWLTGYQSVAKSYPNFWKDFNRNG